ncbi:asparagine synthetase domain-containing protein CG17486 [Eupeodes corollae]|uniref:asparagine synthetase domain-containing protein CG17486 n=1 Tax=Eupeodes corollae TaxID=290404 RepID=UPI0024917EED|nr:asparagine synthetase domain-containing protein CG17486 [Eupeodes corollae]
MCGIICCICHENQKPSLDKKLAELLQNRGPDNHNVTFKNNILFGGFVLWQQGLRPTLQPISHKNWTLLLNGDIFNKNTQNTSNESSDTLWLIENLSTCLNDDHILNLLKTLKGPYSMVLYNSDSNYVYFARDPLGRNSLLIESDSTCLKILSNSFLDHSGSKKACFELPPLGLFKVDAENPKSALLYPWKSLMENNIQIGLEGLNEILQVNASNKCIDPLWLLPSTFKSNYFDFYQLCSSKISAETIYDHLLGNKIVNESISKFIELLRSSVKERVTFTPNYCNICIADLKPQCDHSKVAILFSGGIDCTILAIVANEYVKSDDSIDLINVAFEACKATTNDINWDVPDRCSAKESFEELKQLCPSRNWNLIEVNVTRRELNEELQSHIKHLIYPLNTVLDESLGCAFWFASRGKGYCNGQIYKSTARVILIGSGADELFGGYTRHRNAYTRCNGSHDEKLSCLSQELDMDWERLPSRNLGRDDRVIADNKKTSRAPFIQEDITHFVRNLKPEQRCCFALEQGVGDKLFLRLSGYQLGLRSSIKLKKRAIQFGSRIANKNQNAKDLSINIQ